LFMPNLLPCMLWLWFSLDVFARSTTTPSLLQLCVSEMSSQSAKTKQKIILSYNS
jgi:hypothetical protein